jgi:hypothetical protein
MDVNNGWDGTASGKLSNTGVYIYMLSFNDGFLTRKKEGSLTLIRYFFSFIKKESLNLWK